MELYWHIKNLLGQMLQTREEAHSTMQLQLNGLHLMMHEVLVRLHPTSSIVTPSASHNTENLAPDHTQDRSIKPPGP
jgi:hypothetical protein